MTVYPIEVWQQPLAGPHIFTRAAEYSKWQNAVALALENCERIENLCFARRTERDYSECVRICSNYINICANIPEARVAYKHTISMIRIFLWEIPFTCFFLCVYLYQKLHLYMLECKFNISLFLYVFFVCIIFRANYEKSFFLFGKHRHIEYIEEAQNDPYINVNTVCLCVWKCLKFYTSLFAPKGVPSIPTMYLYNSYYASFCDPIVWKKKSWWSHCREVFCFFFDYTNDERETLF